MTLIVTVSPSTKINATITPATALAATINEFDMSIVKLEELKNVDDTTYGLQDGDTVIYNGTTKQWETRPEEDTENVDGGSF